MAVSNVPVLAANNRWYTVTIRPYRMLKNRIESILDTLYELGSGRWNVPTLRNLSGCMGAIIRAQECLS